MTSASGRRVRRTVAQLVVLALGATALVLLPQPSFAVEREMVVDTVAPDLGSVPAPESPAAAEVVEEIREHAAVGPMLDAPAPGEVPEGPLPEEPADLVGDRLTATEEGLDDFRMIGVQYQGDDHEPALLRVQTDGVWGEWFAFETGAHGPDPITEEPLAQGSSDPIWVDHASGFEVDLPADATDVEVHLVREGDAALQITDGTAQAEGAALGAPGISRRSAWGAAPYRGSPAYGTHIGRGIVHHTVNGNGYSAASVPAMLRGIQSFHQNSNGWSDIGYNFVVDRFGRIWEGRQGGVTRPVIGAHAAGANTNSVGVAALGEYTSAGPSTAMVNAFQAILGWKLSLSGTTPSGHTIVGHRNVGQTSCPGNALYGQLNTIRWGALLNFAAQHPTPRFSSSQTQAMGDYRTAVGDFDGNGRDDILFHGPGDAPDTLWLARQAGGFAGHSISISGTFVPLAGDFDGNGVADILWYGPGDQPDLIWWGLGNRAFSPANVTVSGEYQPFTGDFDGDGRSDVFWYAPGSAQDAAWYGTASRTFSGRQYTVNGTGYVPIAGDFDGDGRDDIFWHGPGSIPDSAWYGSTGRTFSARGYKVSLGGYRPVAGDFNRDGRDDIFWYLPGTGVDTIWVAYGNRTFRGDRFTVNGSYRPLAGHFDGNGVADVFWYAPGAAPDYLWKGL